MVQSAVIGQWVYKEWLLQKTGNGCSCPLNPQKKKKKKKKKKENEKKKRKTNKKKKKKEEKKKKKKLAVLSFILKDL